MAASLEELRDLMAACQKCRLHETRHNVVFGVGKPGSRVLLVGEGPGENEDLKGEPFVGRAGMLLDKMLAAAGFSRASNVYIANIVKCRPPQNRDPAPDEMAACIDILREQIRLIRPEYIVCLGRIAAQCLIGKDFKVTKQHGEFFERGETTLMGTYHPAALLRFPDNKPSAFADLLALRDRIAASPSASILL